MQSFTNYSFFMMVMGSDITLGYDMVSPSASCLPYPTSIPLIYSEEVQDNCSGVLVVGV